jgi:hypothetical protein
VLAQEEMDRKKAMAQNRKICKRAKAPKTNGTKKAK